MRGIIMGASVALLVCASAATVLAQRPTTRRAAARGEARTSRDAAPSGEEKAVRGVAEAYVKAYNAHDAGALARLFTSDAQIVDAQGDTIQGREAIEQVFASAFAEYPQAHTSVVIKGIRFLNPSLAIEDGTANVALLPGEPAEPNDYAVVHVRQNGKWLMASARDLERDTAPPSDHLAQLGWLIGDWVDESDDSVVTTNYRWSENHNFILSDFSIQVAGQVVMTGSQRIGWDPLAGTIRSWVFDSEGGFAQGVYTRDGNRWIIKMTGVTRDGKPASSTNIITRAGRDRMTWQSRDRTVGGEPQADIVEVAVVRPPPKPM